MIGISLTAKTRLVVFGQARREVGSFVPGRFVWESHSFIESWGGKMRGLISTSSVPHFSQRTS